MDSRRRLAARRSRAASLGFRLAMPSKADRAPGRASSEPTVLILCRRPLDGMGYPLDRAVGVGDDSPLGSDAKVDPTTSMRFAWTTGDQDDDRGHRNEQAADNREGEMSTIGLQSHRASAEPDSAVVPVPRLEPGEPNLSASTMAMLGSRPVMQSDGQVRDCARVGFLRAGRPPWGNRDLGLVPGLAKGR